MRGPTFPAFQTEEKRKLDAAKQIVGEAPTKHPEYTIIHKHCAYGGWWEWAEYPDGRISKKCFRISPEVETTLEYQKWEKQLYRIIDELVLPEYEVPEVVRSGIIYFAQNLNNSGLILTRKREDEFYNLTSWPMGFVVGKIKSHPEVDIMVLNRAFLDFREMLQKKSFCELLKST